ncbi:flagellar biosynthetic protein FliR [Acetobacter persici]|uniref:Flagellar biosynthesis protein FliR n=1 Tax=Acetobacter persici TaxID=1076596 RepID=A0A1U9LJ91_9PROT|nr:flagellar biosynthetic protein FliR [Acetobacter persici]AQT06360.1 flagellar biosynthesis protein FliR [Acetobacter persici]
MPNGSLEILSATFAIVLCRVSAIVMTSPGLGETTSPKTVRAGISLAITITLLPVVQGKMGVAAGEAIRMPAMAIAIVAQELLCGAFIGFLARLIAMSLAISMQIVSVFTGMSSIVQPDAQLGASSTAISHMANTLSPVILLTTGLYALPLYAISGSYDLFPPGHMTEFMVSDMAKSISQCVAETFGIAMQLSAPFILIGTLWPAMLGVLNRLMPSIQVYSTAMPAQILGSLLLLAMLIEVTTGTWQERISDILRSLPGILPA